MSDLSAFRPVGAGQSMSVTTTSSVLALNAGSAVRICNIGPDPVRIRFSVAAGVAVTSDMALLVGGTEVFTRPDGQTHIAAITSTGTATLSVTTGEGL